MPKIDYAALPDDARVWVFGTDRPLSDQEERTLLDQVDAFLDDWKAHGAPLTCARDWRHGRFLVVALDERSVPPSGCSIDAMVRVLKGAEAALGVSLVDKHPVWYRSGDEIRRADRAGFRELAEADAVGPDTVVFDQTVTRLGQVRDGQWERPARDAWHGRAFFARAV